MSELMKTLHEIAIEYAAKQPGMVDDLTEEAPILNIIKWTAATHGLWNVAEKLSDVTAPAFVHYDSPLPLISSSSDLVRTELQKMGGYNQVPCDKALEFGGPTKYFEKYQSYILKKAGMDTEKIIVKNNFLKAAILEKNIYDAGGTDKGWYIIACRFDPQLNVGLYDPKCFDQGRLFKIDYPYGGQKHYLKGPKYEGVLGYTVTYEARFGYQLLDAKRTIAAIVNIDEEHHPSINMIDEMLAQVRSKPGTTYLFMGPRARIYGINPYKNERVQLVTSDTDAKTRVDTWNGISIVESHNIDDKIDHIKVK